MWYGACVTKLAMQSQLCLEKKREIIRKLRRDTDCIQASVQNSKVPKTLINNLIAPILTQKPKLNLSSRFEKKHHKTS